LTMQPGSVRSVTMRREGVWQFAPFAGLTDESSRARSPLGQAGGMGLRPS
jgi:hypothetical protein